MNGLENLILKEGRRPVLSVAASALLFSLLDFDALAFIALVVTLVLIWIYRHPVRTVIHFEKGSVTAPCDGKVTAVRTHDDGTMSVEIESGCMDASILSAPFEAVKVTSAVVRGARLSRKSPLFEKLNEYAAVEFTDSGGHRISIIHRLKRSAAALVIDGETSAKGRLPASQRYGVMVSGMTYVRFPESARIAVNPGESVTGAETLLGYVG